jgi:PAS domain S-box-containing protein
MPRATTAARATSAGRRDSLASPATGAIGRALEMLAAARTLEDAVPHLRDIIGWDERWVVGTLFVVNEDAGAMRPVGDWEPDGAGTRPFLEDTRRRTFRPGESLPGRAWQEGAPIWARDVRADRRYVRRSEAIAAGLAAAVFQPLRAGGRVVGLLELYAREVLDPDSALLSGLEAHAGILGQFIVRATAEAAAREQERFFRAVVAVSLDAIVFIDDRGLITGWNPQAEAIFGWSAAEALGRSIAGLFVPEELREAHRAGLERYLRTREPRVLGRRLEMPAVHRDGRRMTVELSIVAHEIDGSVRFIGSLRDITERAEAEARIRELARFPDENPSPVLRIDGAGRVTYANAVASALTGERGGVHRRIRDAVARSLFDGTRRALEVEVGDRSFSLTVQPLVDEGLANVYGLDITERVRAEQELRRNEADIRSLYRIASDVSLDLPARIQQLLALMADRFGMGTGVLSRMVREGLAIAEVNAWDGRLARGDLLPIEETFSGDAIRSGDVLAIADATRAPWDRHLAHRTYGLASYIGAPVMVGGGVYGALSFTSPHPRSEPFREGDLDFLRLMARWVGGELERHQIAAELESANRDLEEAVARARDLAKAAHDASLAKSEFLAAMSHEIRTPLHGVVGSLEVLRSRPDGDGAAEFVETLGSAAEDLRRIVDDILDFSKVEARQLALEPQAVDLRRVVSDVAALYSLRAEQKGVGLEWAVSEDVPDVVVLDPTRVRQVLVNLVANAVKFTSHGSVRVRLGLAAGSAGAAGKEGGPSQLLLEVADTGIGMDAPTLRRAFEPFFQADASTSRRYGGTGLGLSITRRLVELMGGSIEMSSHPGSGTSILARLPFASPAPTPSLRPGAPGTSVTPVGVTRADGSLAAPRVLVVDDDPVSVRIASELLATMGCEVRTAASGRDGLRLLSDLEHDLVLLDCRLPEIDGFEVARRHREMEARSGRHAVPIVATTADAYGETRQACLDAGMSDHLAKPFKAADLAAVLRRWLATPPTTVMADADAGVGEGARAAAAEVEIPEGALLDALRSGGPSRALELAELFVETLAEGSQALIAALGEDRPVEAAEAAHRLRGAAAAVGETDLAAVLARVEGMREPGSDGGGVDPEELLEAAQRSRDRIGALAAALRGRPRGS